MSAKYANTLFLILVLMIFRIPLYAAEENLLKVQQCPESSVTPEIDGRITSDEWRDSVPVSAFVYGADAKLATVQTVVRAKWTTNGLFIGITAFEPLMDKIKADNVGRDGKLWWNDSIEIFIQPNPGTKEYFHFIVDAAGNQYDGIGRSSGWNAGWQTAVSKNRNDWSVEIFFPFAIFGKTPESGDIWRINYMRSRINKGETDDSLGTQWSSAAGNYHRPETFGALFFTASFAPPSAQKQKKLFARIYSYPGPTVRLFVNNGFSDISYTGITGRTVFTETDSSLVRKLDFWIKRLKELSVAEGLPADDIKEIKSILGKWNVSSLSEKNSGGLPINSWVRKRLASEKTVSALSETYWNILLKNKRNELLTE